MLAGFLRLDGGLFLPKAKSPSIISPCSSAYADKSFLSWSPLASMATSLRRAAFGSVAIC